MLNAGLQVGGIEYESGQFWLLLVAVGVFALTGAMRLARFNLHSDTPSTGWFTGIPITAAGGGLISAVVLVLIHYPDVAASMPLHLYMPVLMFVLALLMISRLRFPKAVVRDNVFMNIFQGVIIAGIYYCGITRSYPEYLLGAGIVILISAIIAGRITRDV
jgi:CDP-diacylglycerol--serine O-phosphatidyltransferase